MFDHGFDKLVQALLCGGDTKIRLPKAENGNVFFLGTGEICKRRQSCCYTITVKHRHQRMWRF